jgi:hypothetical protein
LAIDLATGPTVATGSGGVKKNRPTTDEEPNVRARRHLVLILALVALSLLAAAATLAQRPPTAGERAAIRAAMKAFIDKPDSPAAPDDKVTRIRVSTVNTRWATAGTSSPTAGPADAILKKRGSTWKVVSFGSDTPCSVAPRPVLIDLLGACAQV